MIAAGLDMPRAGSLEAFLAFYDRCGDFQGNAGKLAVRLVEQRHKRVNVSLARGMARKALGIIWPHDEWQYSGKDLLAVEVASLGLSSTPDDRRVMAGVLDMDQRWFDRTVDRVETHTDEAADQVVKLVELIRDDPAERQRYSEIIGVDIDDDMPPMILAALLMATAGHEGQKRVNGGRDYITHPVATAYLYQMAWNEAVAEAQLRGIAVPDETWLERQLVVNLWHDVIEDSLPSEGGSFLEGPASRVTPLLMRKVLTRFGESDEMARDMVDDVLRVTKMRGPDGEKQPKADYVKSCLGKIRSMLAKFCDTAHNKMIDAKNDGSAVKLEAEYQQMLDAIETHIMEGMSDEFGRLCVEKILKVAKAYPGHDEFMNAARQVALGRTPVLV